MSLANWLDILAVVCLGGNEIDGVLMDLLSSRKSRSDQFTSPLHPTQQLTLVNVATFIICNWFFGAQDIID